MKKIMICILLLGTIFLIACGGDEDNDKKEGADSKVKLELDASSVDRVFIGYGTTGERKEIVDADVIDKIITNVTGVEMSREHLEPFTGYTYWISLYRGQEKTDEFYLNSAGVIVHNEYLYSDSSNSLCYDYVSSLFTEE